MRLSLLICAGVLAAGLATWPQPSSSQDASQDSPPADQSANAGQPAQDPQPAATSDAASDGPNVFPLFDQGFANDSEVASAVGQISYRMDTCAIVVEYAPASDSRVVSATLSRVPDDFEQRGALIDAILRRAAQYAWRECPFPFADLNHHPTGDFHYDLHLVNILGPDGQVVASASLRGRGLDTTGDQALWSSRVGYVWREYRNGLAEQRAQAAAAQQQQALAAQRQAQQAIDAENGRRAAASFWRNVWLFGFAALAIWLFLKREAIARWYYALKPHPAANIVDRAIYRGGQIDGEVYERVLRPVPGSRIEREVRSKQANELTQRLRQHEAVLRSEEAKRVEDERRRIEQENAFMRAHAELLKAGVDHEIAAARLDELRKATQKR